MGTRGSSRCCERRTNRELRSRLAVAAQAACDVGDQRLSAPIDLMLLRLLAVGVSGWRFAQAPISLEKPVGDEEESEFGEFIADEQAESPYERAVQILTNEALRAALENLSYRERHVLKLRYGLGEQPRAHSRRSHARQRHTRADPPHRKPVAGKLQKLPEAQQLRDGEIAPGFAPPTLGTQRRRPSG